MTLLTAVFKPSPWADARSCVTPYCCTCAVYALWCHVSKTNVSTLIAKSSLWPGQGHPATELIRKCSAWGTALSTSEVNIFAFTGVAVMMILKWNPCLLLDFPYRPLASEYLDMEIVGSNIYISSCLSLTDLLTVVNAWTGLWNQNKAHALLLGPPHNMLTLSSKCFISITLVALRQLFPEQSWLKVRGSSH